MKRRTFLEWLWLFLFCFFWYASIATGKSAHKGLVHVLCNEECIDETAFSNALENFHITSGGNLDWVLYRKIESQNLRNDFQNNEANVMMVLLKGNVSLSTRQMFVAGGYFQQDDMYACVVDKNTAFELFGTTQSIGGKITWNSKTYTVSGVLDTKERVCLINSYDKIGRFQYLTCNLRDKQLVEGWREREDKEIVEEFVGDYIGISSQLEAVVVESGYAALLNGMAKIPMYLLFIWALFTFRWSEIWKQGWKRRIIGGVFAVLFFVAFWVIGDLHFTVNPNMVPAQWSNLEFYSEKWSIFVAELNALWNQKVILDVLLIKNNLLQGFCYSSMSTIWFLSGIFTLSIRRMTRSI